MIKIIKNIKYSKGPAQYRRRKSSGSGFVILYAVTLSAILLSIALGVANVALKEVKFSTSAKDTNEAFFAADTGAEQALYNDKSTINLYSGSGSWPLSVFGLGSNGLNCVNVSIVKTSSTTSVVSKGYNSGVNVAGICNSGVNAVERELDVNY